jgi:hypothetical protein
MATEVDKSSDWATFVTSHLDGLVTTIRRYSVDPAAAFARKAVIGTLAGVIGLAVALVTLIGLIHLLDTTAFRGHAFITDFAVGGILLGGGTFLLGASARAGRSPN